MNNSQNYRKTLPKASHLHLTSSRHGEALCQQALAAAKSVYTLPSPTTPTSSSSAPSPSPRTTPPPS